MAGLLAFTSACAANSGELHAQNVATNIPVLVVTEDQDKTSVNHCNDVHKRVAGELRGSMQRHGYQMLDEESIRAELNWGETCKPPYNAKDRRSKQTVISDIKRMISAKKAQVPVRAWVLYRIHAQKVKYGSGYDAQVRINGEIYDAVSNKFLDNFQAKRLRFPLPDNCSKVCVYEVVGDHASDIAANVGEILARKLKRYSPGETAGKVASGGAVTGEGNKGGSSGRCKGLLTPFNITLKHFDKVESASIIDVMADEFPCYHSHELLSGSEVVRKYAYNTHAKSHKMEEWFIILLRDMGFKDKEYAMEIDGKDIVISKLVPTPNRPRSVDESKRFK
ncbi:MAG: hypothetical protein MJE12_05925 [Alphaproteobacteria bacterium]|nr:hypothetical protein [Alphaproteobacteria bacterium]